MTPFRLNIDTVYEFDSPIEFALVATVGARRAVIVKSKGARVDLPAYAQGFRDPDSHRYSRPSPFEQIFFPTNEDLRPQTVDSSPFNSLRTTDYDERPSQFSFIWRGAEKRGLKGSVEEHLNNIVPAITQALEHGSRAEIEWLISPMVAECQNALVAARAQRFAKATRFKLLVGTALLYAMTVGAAYIWYLRR